MEYRNLGNSGLMVSALSYGTYLTLGIKVDDNQAIDLMRTAYEAGVNFFDNAEVYAAGESEAMMGRALKALNWDRSSYCVSSKVIVGGDLPTQQGTSRKHLYDACDAALNRMQLDYLDLFYCHRYDPKTPISEVVWTMNQLINQGKIRYWGTSEWSPHRLQQAYHFARENHLIPPTMEQPQYNIFHRVRMEHDYMDLFHHYKLGTTVWSPLASGLLTGKYSDGIPTDSRGAMENNYIHDFLDTEQGQQRLDQIKQLSTIADSLNCTLAQLAIAWCLKNAHVSTVILGASKVTQLQENLNAMNIVERIDATTYADINALTQSHESIVPNYKRAFKIND